MLPQRDSLRGGSPHPALRADLPRKRGRLHRASREFDPTSTTKGQSGNALPLLHVGEHGTTEAHDSSDGQRPFRRWIDKILCFAIGALLNLSVHSAVDLYQRESHDRREADGGHFRRNGDHAMWKLHIVVLPAATLIASLVASSAHAQTCAAGYTMHPRLHACVAEPICGEGAILHPRLHLCVAQPACATGTWHPRLNRCVGA